MFNRRKPPGKKRSINEENISTLSGEEVAGSWFQKAHVHEKRKKGAQKEKKQGKTQIDRRRDQEMKKEGFPKAIRIKKKAEFDQIIKQGRKTVGENLVLYRLNSDDKEQKFGIKVNRNIKGAAKRNRIKRLLREILRKNKDKFKGNERILLFYRSNAARITHQDLLSEFEGLVG